MWGFSYKSVECSVEEEHNIIETLFAPEQYNKDVRPGNVDSPDGPTEVTSTVFIRNIEEISTKNMDFTVDITFRQQWIDPRLKYKTSKLRYLTLPKEDMVWKPDTFFRNEKEASFHHVPNKQYYVRVFPDGTILYSLRTKLKLACPMNLRRYPFDTQQCQIHIASYAHTTDTLSYLWKESSPVQMASMLSAPGMMVENFGTEHCDVRTSTGTYSCLSLELTLKRASSPYVLTEYVPYAMIVIISWAPFWLKQKDSLARIGITLATLFMASAKAAAINNVLPSVAYTKAIDVWTGWCTLFIFCTFVVCVVINWLGEEEKESNLVKADAMNRWKNASVSLKIDYVARFVFPLAFILFNIIYWCTY
eukprot:TRINITY_DN4541_c0_g1_i3.p1 TRINITY_DN4541_c0_g1~~TRINITY_DN4541_c0_g1_i3.p1  ORF type:complete len:363 (-),score=47.86 TRINITY_DN4541_c0_g1_i3:101-1189(-)